jgi:hypothetical protein
MDESAGNIKVESETLDEDISDTKQMIFVLKAINQNLMGINQSLKLIYSNIMMRK